jgi:hypothetical protein
MLSNNKILLINCFRDRPKNTLAIGVIVLPNQEIEFTCSRISASFFSIGILKTNWSMFYSSKSFFILRFLDSFSKLLLFSSNNRFMSSFALLVGYRPAACHPDLIFLAVKVSSLAL